MPGVKFVIQRVRQDHDTILLHNGHPAIHVEEVSQGQHLHQQRVQD